MTSADQTSFARPNSVPGTAVPVRPPSPLVIALVGLVSLSLAMGLGRFSFTPLLPMMLHDGRVDLAQGSWLATSNYLGYFAGAALCSVLPSLWRRLGGSEPPAERLALGGLAATAVLLGVMALPWPAVWGTARFLAGVASAVAFVFVSSWCLLRLAQRQATALAGLIYTGPGVGIAVSGLGVSAMVSWGWHSAAGWVVMALLACAGLAWVVRVLQRDRDANGPAAAHVPNTAGRPAEPPAAVVPPAGRGGSRTLVAWIVVGYGLAGFGYIITATFLPVMARDALPGSAWIDLFWPLFGLAVIAGCLIATRLPQHWDNRLSMAVCYGLQAVGVVMGLLWPTVAGFVLGSLLVGLPFTALTLFTLREVRQRWPQQAASLIALVTAAYAIGQILGPPLVNALLAHTASRAQGFAWSLATACGALLAGMVVWLVMYRRVP